MSTPIEAIMDRTEMWPVQRSYPPPSDGTLYATHEGILDLGEVKLRVYQLNNGQRVIDAKDAEEFFNKEPK